ncbi:hypothetical protein BBP40_007908 [Aspergillus hancockii]|nr:hypothetical protein BBP40_007908 [Aspergillus hancockii]
MSVGAVLAQLSVTLAHMESIGPKLRSNIRPSRDQLNNFLVLSTRLREASASIDANLQDLLLKGAPKERDLELAKQIRAAPLTGQISPSVGNTLRKNLVLIFQGPLASALDTNNTRIRKNQTRTRCEKLRAQSHHVILQWSSSLQPSAWNTSVGMTDSTFDFLIEDLKSEEMSRVSPQLVQLLGSLEKEQPLQGCKPFELFVQDIALHMAGTTSHKRKRLTEVSSFHEGSYKPNKDDSQPQTQLIGQRKQIDYKMSSMPTSKLPILIDKLPTAIKSSEQWKWERRIFSDNIEKLEGDFLDRTDSLNFFIPKDRNHDISITLTVGHEVGLEVIGEVEAIDV